MNKTESIKTSVKTAINTKDKSVFCPTILIAITETPCNRKIHNAREDL